MQWMQHLHEETRLMLSATQVTQPLLVWLIELVLQPDPRVHDCLPLTLPLLLPPLPQRLQTGAPLSPMKHGAEIYSHWHSLQASWQCASPIISAAPAATFAQLAEAMQVPIYRHVQALAW